jgi:hypothetical protein
MRRGRGGEVWMAGGGLGGGVVVRNVTTSQVASLVNLQGSKLVITTTLTSTVFYFVGIQTISIALLTAFQNVECTVEVRLFLTVQCNKYRQRCMMSEDLYEDVQ